MLKSRAFLIPGIVVVALSFVIGNACADNINKSWKIGLQFAPGYDLPAGSFKRFFDGGPSYDGSLLIRTTDQIDVKLTIGKVGLKSGETPVPIDLSAYRIVLDALYHKTNPKMSAGTIYPYAIAGAGVIQCSYDMNGHSDSGTDLLLASGGGLFIHILSNIVLDISIGLDMTVSRDYEYSITNDQIDYYRLHYCNMIRFNIGLVALL